MVGQAGKKSYWRTFGEWIAVKIGIRKERQEEWDLSREEYTNKVSELGREIVAERRRILDAIGKPLNVDVEPASMGLAFSGGGIRSATVSLGIAQALAREDRLLDFDYCSTVSGGGYFGSFLGSLFLPDGARGQNAKATSTPDAARSQFAMAALRSKSCVTDIEGPRQQLYRHPVRWLREHSRYLAPNGSSDLFAGAAYVIRNWSAMVYVLVLPMALASLLLIDLSMTFADSEKITPPKAAPCVQSQNPKTEHGGAAPKRHASATSCPVVSSNPAENKDGRKSAVRNLLYWKPAPPDAKASKPAAFGYLFSTVWLLAAFLAFCGMGSGLAYWLTEYLSDRGSLLKAMLAQSAKPQRFAWVSRVCGTLFSTKVKFLWSIAVSAGVAIAALSFWLTKRKICHSKLVSWKPGTFISGCDLVEKAQPLDWLLVASAALGMCSCIFALFAAIRTGMGTRRKDAFTAEVRRRLTRTNAHLLLAALCVAVIALIDSVGLSGYAWIVQSSHAPGSVPFWSGLPILLAPASAWIINKIPGWFKEGEGRIGKLIGQNIWTVAFIVGAALYGLLCVAVHIGLQYLLFGGALWAGPSNEQALTNITGFDPFFIWPILLGATYVLFWFTGVSQGFLNLSSLHGIYAARLTRAYLGGTNLNRLRLSNAAGRQHISNRSIKESDADDQIPIDVYQQTRSAGPLHLINTTLNETLSDEKSQLLERDRKGVPLVFAPEGVFIDTAKLVTARSHFSWERMKAHGVEGLSVGQLCAISGAAASTAMGGKTTLGGALALSFANVRLGYWWHVNDMINEADGTLPGPIGIIGRLASSLVGLTTYAYLLREIRAKYQRNTPYINLSDGGHFDNSGAYELLRRNVRTIVVSDNGADPNFLFEDLENLVRKARIDLGMSVVVADKDEVSNLVGSDGAKLFLNGSDADWRQRAAARSADGVAVTPVDPAFCLLLKIYGRHWDGAKFSEKEAHSGHIIWMKPRLYEGLPPDVTGYATSHRQFPQETTGDQFFDEAQWESYRALGFGMMRQLLAGSFAKENILRYINQRSNLQQPDGA